MILELLSEELKIILHALPGFCGQAKNLHSRPNRFDAPAGGLPVELDCLGQLILANDGNIGAVEDGGILQRFVLTFGDRHQYDAQIFSEIVGRGADEIADVLDEQEIEFIDIPSLQGILHHGCFEMAQGAGGDLLDRGLAAGETHCVIFGGEITHQRRYAVFWLQQGQSFLQEGGFAGAGTRHQADYEDSGASKLLTQSARDDVILLQDIAPDFDETRLAHSCTSRAKTSSSLPCRMSMVGVPHSGHKKDCTDCSTRVSWHRGQNTVTGTSSTIRRDPASGVS